MGSVIRVTACIVLGALVGACSSGGGSEGKGIPTDVATALAARADRVAADLDAGACDQALTEAHSLQADVGALKVGRSGGRSRPAGRRHQLRAAHHRRPGFAARWR